MKNKKKKRTNFLYSAAVTLAHAVGLHWGSRSMQTTYFTIESGKIPASFNGFTIVQVADLHNSSFGSKQEILLNEIKKVSPDIIAVTGDLIDTGQTENSMEFINGSVIMAPVYYVAGNHEARIHQYENIKLQMMDAGVIILDDESIILDNGTDSIKLLGLSDPAFTDSVNKNENIARIKSLLGNMAEDNKYNILLSHRPELFDTYVDNSVDLVLTGHAHGGQVRLPFIGGLFAPNQGVFPKYTEGVHEQEQTKMIVSRGLKNALFPPRINNRPELIVVTLKSTDT